MLILDASTSVIEQRGTENLELIRQLKTWVQTGSNKGTNFNVVLRVSTDPCRFLRTSNTPVGPYLFLHILLLDRRESSSHQEKYIYTCTSLGFGQGDITGSVTWQSLLYICVKILGKIHL